MFKNLSIKQRIIMAMMVVVTSALLVANIMHFFLFNNATAEVIRTSSREINKQVIMNYERYIDEVIATANYLSRKTIEMSEDNEVVDLADLYLQAAQMSQDVVSIILFNEAGVSIINGDERVVIAEVGDVAWFLSALRDKEIFHFSTPHAQSLYEGSSIEVVTVTKSVRYYEAGELKEGVLAIDLNTENLIGLALKTNLGENGHIIILNDASAYVYSSAAECVDAACESIAIVETIVLGGDSVLLNEDYMYVNVNTLKNTRWRIATFININQIYQTRQSMNLIASSIFLGALLLSLIVSVFVSKRISDPLIKLEEYMARIEKGDMTTEVVVTGQKEVVLLSNTFNKMIGEIRHLMSRIVTEQKEKRKSEFLALQTQINPHFLYNTLDSIVWLAENNKNSEVIEMVIALSRFFRISISRGKNVIAVKDELEHAKQYLQIQKIRYNRKFDYQFNVQPQVFQYSVVKLVLQPIIENAIHHGINSEFESGMIQINAFTKGKKLIFEIENNGYGITPERIAELYQSMKEEEQANSVGLRNVYQRLKLYYGDEADLEITSELDRMTNVRLVIPLRKDYADEKVT
jgi:two-component system, sensor histidine kinase YesM